MTPATAAERVLKFSEMIFPLQYISPRLQEYRRDAKGRFFREVIDPNKITLDEPVPPSERQYRLIVKDGELKMVRDIYNIMKSLGYDLQAEQAYMGESRFRRTIRRIRNELRPLFRAA